VNAKINQLQKFMKTKINKKTFQNSRECCHIPGQQNKRTPFHACYDNCLFISLQSTQITKTTLSAVIFKIGVFENKI